MAKRAERSISEIEEHIKKLSEQIKRKKARELQRYGKIADAAGLVACEISDEDLLKEFTAMAGRFPKKAKAAAA